MIGVDKNLEHYMLSYGSVIQTDARLDTVGLNISVTLDALRTITNEINI